MKLFDVFNEKETENGDRAYKSTRNKYLDVLFASNYYRHNPDKIPEFLDKKLGVWQMVRKIYARPKTERKRCKNIRAKLNASGKYRAV